MIHLSIDEVAGDFRGIVERIARSNQTVMVERDGAPLVLLKPLPSRRGRVPRGPTEADYKAALVVAGSWKDVDIDKFLADNSESRRVSNRTPVEL